jgi:hypothetical protein
MAYVVPRKGGMFELRESHATPAGPRSRTLASFSELTAEAIERAQARATRTLDVNALRQAARRAGAPVAAADSDRAAAELLGELANGRAPRPPLRRLLRSMLGDDTPEARGATDNARAAAAWLSASPARRGKALEDLLLLADSLPQRRRESKMRFPRIESSVA